MTLNAFPYVAVPAYWVLGRNKFEGYVTARQDGDHEIRHIAKLAGKNTLDLRSTRAEEVASSRTGENLAKIPYLRGNEVELLVDGDATFTNIFEGIAAAENYILVIHINSIAFGCAIYILRSDNGSFTLTLHKI